MCVCDELHKMKRNYKKESRQEQFLYDKMHKENYIGLLYPNRT